MAILNTYAQTTLVPMPIITFRVACTICFIVLAVGAIQLCSPQKVLQYYLYLKYLVMANSYYLHRFPSYNLEEIWLGFYSNRFKISVQLYLTSTFSPVFLFKFIIFYTCKNHPKILVKVQYVYSQTQSINVKVQITNLKSSFCSCSHQLTQLFKHVSCIYSVGS